MTVPAPRLLFAALFAIAAGALAAGIVYFQGVLELLPCPLCVVQRIAFMAVALVALAAAVHDPGPTGRRLYGGGAALAALFGLVVALRHTWLIYFPVESFSCEISPEERFLNSLPLARWWPGMFEAEGDCLEIGWSLLGLGIPEWAALLFTALLLLAVAAGFARR